MARLRALLEAEGAEVLQVPTIKVEDAPDGGAALRAALLEVWDWVVVTSANGADRAVAAAGGRAAAAALPWAVVGPGTADALEAHGIHPSLVPERFVAEGLLEAFPAPPHQRPGRVLVAQAEAARPVLVDGLRARGWEVDAVVAYRTVPVRPADDVLAAARDADAVAFTSGSTVDGYVGAAGTGSLPPVVVAIGPVDRGGRRPSRPRRGGGGRAPLAGRPRGGRRGRALVTVDGVGVEAFVFDLDGTIADTESVEYDAIRRVWADHGLDYPIERWSHVVGHAWSPGWVSELEAEAAEVVDPGAARAAKGRYHDELLTALVMRPGVAELLAAATEAGIPLAIASNSDSDWVEHVLERLDLVSNFVAITTIDRVEQGKPHPEPFLAACARLGASPERSVAFEDSATGVASAVAAGLYTVACRGPLTVGHDVTAADLVVASLEEVTLASLQAVMAGRDPPARRDGAPA